MALPAETAHALNPGGPFEGRRRPGFLGGSALKREPDPPESWPQRLWGSTFRTRVARPPPGYEQGCPAVPRRDAVGLVSAFVEVGNGDAAFAPGQSQPAAPFVSRRSRGPSPGWLKHGGLDRQIRPDRLARRFPARDPRRQSSAITTTPRDAGPGPDYAEAFSRTARHPSRIYLVVNVLLTEHPRAAPICSTALLGSLLPSV